MYLFENTHQVKWVFGEDSKEQIIIKYFYGQISMEDRKSKQEL